MVAVLASIGWPEIVALLCLILILFGVKRFPDGLRGLRAGLSDFDDEASHAGKSVGGIYGKPAVEALTPDNQNAELYEPAVFRNKGEHPKREHRFWRWILMLMLKLAKQLT